LESGLFSILLKKQDWEWVLETGDALSGKKKKNYNYSKSQEYKVQLLNLTEQRCLGQFTYGWDLGHKKLGYLLIEIETGYNSKIPEFLQLPKSFALQDPQHN